MTEPMTESAGRPAVWPTRGEVAALIDHTLLKPEATPEDVRSLITEAADLGVLAVCVSPSMLPVDLPDAGVGLIVAAVVGFPSGKHLSPIKAHEAALAVAAGATEIDMVIDVGAAVAGDFAAVQADIEAVRRAVPSATLKVIIESAALLELSGAEAVRQACRVCEAAGADFVKTSTGFHPSGGATVEAVRIMAETVGDRLQIKASGGIRTPHDAAAMLDAGATRLGLSSSRAVLDGFSA
ncbi:deoxyribose-phosphate aldolase [Mycobacteroides chelonae]|nr:deoxyribose-phosphate aldolase [Mycobacteroides chelonae]